MSTESAFKILEIQNKLIQSDYNLDNKKQIFTYKTQLLKNKLIINNFLSIKRKKYSMFSSEVKKKCIEACAHNDIKSVSKMFSVPLKSLKRWLKVGPDRKRGGGRKIREPDMEVKLFSWYEKLKNNKIPITPKMIKQEALSLSKFKNFIASKGWLEKIKKKYNLQLTRENININNNNKTKNINNNNNTSCSTTVIGNKKSNCKNTFNIIFSASPVITCDNTPIKQIK